MGRSRTGTSAINRRKFVAKAKTSTASQATPAATQQAAPQASPASNNRVVQGSSSVNAAGLVVAAPGAAARASGDKPVSSTIDGKEIKVDDEGRMDLTEIAKMDVFSAGARGAVVPTEQMVGVVKDVAYGVASEDQRTMESGLDLLLNPIIRPFADERMKTENVISEEWYWPEELKTNWNVLPGFMQKSDRVETRSFIDGASANVGNIGAIAQSPLAHQIAADELATSEKRFNTSSGTQAYYIGSALGEIPYFIIGAGQVKAVGTIAAKTTAGVVRGGGIVNTAKVVSTAYKLERATEKLQKVSNKANLKIDDHKIVSKSEVNRAVKLLKDGYAINIRKQKNAKNLPKDQADLARELSAKATQDSKHLNKFTPSKMEKIEAMKENTPTQRDKKRIKIDAFNADVQDILLPDMRNFKEGYVAIAKNAAANTRVEKLANAIGGTPGNMSKRMDDYFNKRKENMGDAGKSTEDFLRDELNTKVARGEYSGVMGNVKFNKDLFGNTLRTALGINRTQKKAGEIISTVQRSISNVRIVTKDDLLAGNKSLQDFVTTSEQRVINLERQNINLQKRVDIGSTPSNRSRKGGSEADTYDPDYIEYNKNFAGEMIPSKPVKIKTVIKRNEKEIKRTNKQISAAEESIASNESEILRSMSYTRTKGTATSKTPRYRFDFQVFQSAYGVKAADILPEKVIMSSKPSVSVRRVKGQWEGQIGDTKETSKTFFVDQIQRSEAIKIYGPGFVSKEPSIFKSIGTRRVGRYRTLIPKKAEPMEDIVYMYEATDALRSAGYQKSGVRPAVIMEGGLSLPELALRKKTYGLREFEGDRKVQSALIGNSDKTLLEYVPIGSTIMDEVKRGKTSPTIDGRDVADMLINRADLENRTDEFDFFSTIKMKTLTQDITQLAKEKADAIASVKRHKNYKPETIVASIEKVKKKFDIKKTSLEDQIASLEKRRGASPEERRRSIINIQAHTIADQKGTITSFPMEILKKAREAYSIKHESNMILDTKTKKEYYISGEDWYEVLSPGFKPSMVSNTDQKKAVRLASKETVYPTSAGLSDRDPFRPLGKNETYDISVMGSDTKIGLDDLARSEPMSDKSKNILGESMEGVAEPGDPNKRVSRQSGKTGFWIHKDNVTPDDMGKVPEKAKQPKQTQRMNQLQEQMKSNLIFLDDDKTYKGMIKKVSAEDQFILKSGSTIGSRQARYNRRLAEIQQGKYGTDAFHKDGSKITDAEKRTGKYGGDPKAPRFTTDFSRKSDSQRAKQNVGIYTSKGVLGILEDMGDRKNKLRSKVFGDRFVPLEIKDFAPDDTTYRQTLERGVANIPEGTAVRTSFSDVNITQLFAVSQSDSMVQGSVPGGVRVVPVQDISPTTHAIKEKLLRENPGKGLDATKQTNYEKMFSQAVGKNEDLTVSSDVVRDFKLKMVEQIYTKIRKMPKPEEKAMAKYMDENSPAYARLINKYVNKRDNANLKRLNRKEKIALKIKNKGKTNKQSVINPDDFESIIGKVSLDTRNPIRREIDAFKFRNLYRTESEIGTSGTRYTVDGKPSGQYRPKTTPAGNENEVRRPSLFGKLFEVIGDKKQDNYQIIEQNNPLELQAMKEVMQEPRFAAYRNDPKKDKKFTQMYNSIMGRGETAFEGSTRVVREGENIAYASSNLELKRLLAELEAKQTMLETGLNTKIAKPRVTKGHGLQDTRRKRKIQKTLWSRDANINQKKIDEVKSILAEEDTMDVARQSDADEWDFVNRKFEFDADNNLRKVDPKPRNRWGKEEGKKRQEDSAGESSQDILFNISQDQWDGQNLRLGMSETENVLPKDKNFNPEDFPEGGQFIEGTKPSPRFSISAPYASVKRNTRGYFMELLGMGTDQQTSSSRRQRGASTSNYIDEANEAFEKQKQKQAKNIINNNSPVSSLTSYLAKPENAKAFSAPEYKKAASVFGSDQTLQPVQQGSTTGKSVYYDDGTLSMNARLGQTQKPVGITQQAPLQASLGTTIGNLFKPSDTTATESDKPFLELPTFTLNQASAQMTPQKNILEQTVGDIQKTISSVEAGNNRIGEGADGTVKSYEMAESLNIFGNAGRTLTDRSSLQRDNVIPDLLSGLNLGQSQPQQARTSTVTLQALSGASILDSVLGQASGQLQKQTNMYKGAFDTFPKPRMDTQSLPIPTITPKPIPQRVMPIVPLFPTFDPVEAAKNRRSRMKKKKPKKTWWQTPENWYEPYYWGGKDQQGAGYVVFSGQEPTKVKKYEKKHFGIGVNDSPFNVRSKWF